MKRSRKRSGAISRRHATCSPSFRIERLEPRQMMAADPLAHVEPVSYFDESSVANPYPAVAENFGVDGLPILHSNPSSTKTLHLNFRGNVVTGDWIFNQGQNIKGLETYTFDFDNDASHFGAVDQSMIRQIWSIVAEDFAPFDIDVTTDYSGGYGNGLAVNVAIGDTNMNGTLRTGTARLDGFVNGVDLPAIVPTENIRREMAIRLIEEDYGVSYKPDDDMILHYMDARILDIGMAIGNTVSHESGHFFGMEHDRASNGDEYDRGTDVWTPIMGTNLAHDRSTWSLHLVNWEWIDHVHTPIYQDNFAQLIGVLGPRLDDHGDSDELAQPMADVTAGIRFEGSGIISTMSDVDVFSFVAPRSGEYAIDVNVPAYANLDVAVDWYGSAGTMLDDAGLDLHRSVWLEEGVQYFLRVRSHGVYGDLGHYSAAVTWDLPEIGPYPEMFNIPYIPELDLIDPNPDVWYDAGVMGELSNVEYWSAGELPLVDAIDGAFDSYGVQDSSFDETIAEPSNAYAPVESYSNDWSLSSNTLSAYSIRARNFHRF